MTTPSPKLTPVLVLPHVYLVLWHWLVPLPVKWNEAQYVTCIVLYYNLLILYYYCNIILYIIT